jgi:hypothetical protein
MALNYYDSSSIIITSQPAELDPDSILYQEENVWKKYKRLSRKITAVNIGPGLLYIRLSHDGTYFSEETVILEGESKDFDEIYVLRLRSPTANLRYRVTEYNITTVSGQQFSGSRIKDRRDRDGVIVFQDDMESPTLKFVPAIIGAGTVTRSTDTAYIGDFSLKMVTGANPGDRSDAKYFHTDFHRQKVGIQVQFASASNQYDIDLAIQYEDGINQYTGDVFVTVSGSTNSFELVGGIVLSTDNNITSAITAWNSMKLVIDISTKKFVSAIINGTKIDLSGFNLVVLPFVGAKYIQTFIGLASTAAGSVATAYFDNYIMTEDET